MTYKEFNCIALASRSTDSPAIFLMEIVTIKDLQGKKRQHYPKYKICTYLEAFTNTLDEAEELMMADISKRNGKEDEQVFCYYVTEKPLGKVLYKRDYISKRMYDDTGTLLEKSCCPSFGYANRTLSSHPFCGRPENAVRFHVGDIVEVNRGNVVSLAVVAGTPPSVERCWEVFNKNEKKWYLYPFDDTDDVYIVLNGPGYGYHEHISPLNVFTPHFHIPTQMERRMKRYLDKMDK